MQSRLITSPPVKGMMKGDEFDCEFEESDDEDPDVEVPEAGTVEVGAGEVGVITTVVSTTVTWKLPRLIFPASSVAKQLTAVAPRLKVEPEAGEQVTSTDASKLSVAEAE